ncbi:DM13 domain-containing protein [Vibrio europaeus]|uniref:DM13 domain-containing protein n=1 Tax=Vibrio europaeus TaxID=300876 RepID=A0A178J847_9VIBR|nr:DM13 domain-containing protein [Vibrio europaeus]MDC5704896.1 DM13 domain-containing protein [Vibrio europaeus]MDC5710175.1 DM13 domain-containing protein [Vibrio europaeus]MDC5715265.1 DM13 domain-containing protein [Vibrio europaeus]MDC5718881.1 DM13 domain-containing protein [Vibrio europaeus]MDC5724686.1 DM13 domain-containing protein [Vibrio europaeus]
MKKLLLIITHCACIGLGFALGIYALPILIQPTSPSMSDVQTVTNNAIYNASFQKDRKDSDFLHWGEGSVSISADKVAFVGELAPGPDYKLYFSPTFVETEADFNAQKQTMVQVGEVKSFDRFTVSLPKDFAIQDYNTVVVWCETFGEFITSARYK